AGPSSGSCRGRVWIYVAQSEHACICRRYGRFRISGKTTPILGYRVRCGCHAFCATKEGVCWIYLRWCQFLFMDKTATIEDLFRFNALSPEHSRTIMLFWVFPMDAY